jgi:hypothetical protein
MENIKLNVGDKVRWSGSFCQLINGWSIEDAKNKIYTLSRSESNKFLDDNTISVKKRGVGLIKKIEYDDLFGCVMITLNNGKMFGKEDKLKLVKSK